MKKTLLGMLFATTLLSGCNYDETLNKLMPKAESELAKQLFEDLRNRKYENLKKYLSKELLTPDIESKLSQAASFFPEGEPIEVKPIGANIHSTQDKWLARLTYQYRFQNGWAVANILLEKENENLVVKQLHVARSTKPLEEIYAFNLKDKTAVHYVFLALVIAIPLLTLYALVLCVKTPMSKKKWPWVVFILLGFTTISLDWTTGHIAYQLLSINLFGAGVVRPSPYAAWILTISIPVGAIVFLFKRKSLIKRS